MSVGPASAVLGSLPGSVPNVVNLGSSWAFATSIVQADPGTGAFRLNNAAQASATAMFVSDLADSGVDVGSNLDQLEIGDRIYMQDRGDKSKFHLFSVTGAPIDNTSWHEIPIASVDAGTAFAENDLVTHGFHLGAADSPELFTTVVGTSAELEAALTSPGAGDTFIKAGAYSINLTTMGAIDATARTIQGAGAEKVVITVVAGGVPSMVDFSATVGAITGVVVRDVTFTTSDPLVGPGVLSGVFGGSDIRILGTAGVNANGFFGCFNLSNCVAKGFSGVPGGAGFAACIGVVNCTVDEFDSSAYSFCSRLASCNAFSLATVGVIPDDAGYSTCFDVAACEVDYTPVTSATTIHHAMRNCEKVSAMDVIGPAGTPGGIGTLEGVTGGFQYSAVEVSGKFDIGFATTETLAGCKATLCVTSGFESCTGLSACKALSNGGNGFTSCTTMGGCISTSNTLNGFNLCLFMGGCLAASNIADGFQGCETVSGASAADNVIGFDACENLAGVHADANASHGFAACIGIVSANATGNGGFGYALVNDRISSARGSANTSGLSDVTNTAVDAATAAGV